MKYDQPIYRSKPSLVLDESAFNLMLGQPVTTTNIFEVEIAGEKFSAARIDSPSQKSILDGYAYAKDTQYVIFFVRN